MPGPGMNVTGDDGNPVTESWILTDSSVLVRWTGFGVPS